MPKAKDITGDIGKLRDKAVLPAGAAPPMPVARLERKPAFNSISFFFWTLIIFFLVLQAGFLIWLL